MEAHHGWMDATLRRDRSSPRQTDDRTDRNSQQSPWGFRASPRAMDMSSPQRDHAAASRSASAFGRRSGLSSPMELHMESSDAATGLAYARDPHRSVAGQKLQGAQYDAGVMQEELKETNSRLSRVTMQLNEQKVEFSSLTQRYGETVEKLTATEGSVKRLEEQLVLERQRHATSQGECERLKTMLQEAQWETERLRRELQQERERPTVDQREVQRILGDRSRYIPASEVQQRLDEIRDTHKAFAGRLTDSFSVLLRAQEEDEAAAFATRNSVLSLTSDLETKLSGVESMLTTLQDQLLAFSEVSENEAMEMANTLIMENKELWKHLSTLKGENETLSTKLEAMNRRGDLVPRDQHECTQKKLALTTDKLTDALETVEAQARKKKADEKRISELSSDVELLRDQVRRLTVDATAAQEELSHCKEQLREAKLTAKESTRRADELWELLNVERRQKSDKVSQMDNDIHQVKREYEQLSERLRKEQEKARKEAQRAKNELNEAQENVKALQRELSKRDACFENYKQQSEEQHQEMTRTMKEDMSSTKKRLEQELDRTQRRLQKQLDVVGEAERDRDRERSERRTAEAAAAKLEAEVVGLRTENEQQQVRIQQLTERVQKMELDLDQMRQRRDNAENEVRQLHLEASRLQDHKCELEEQLSKMRQSQLQESQKYKDDVQRFDKNSSLLHEKLNAARLRISELEKQQQNSMMKEARLEDSLKHENSRLQKQNSKIQEENDALRKEMRLINDKMKNLERVSEQLNDVRERLQLLPALRQAADDARRDVEQAVRVTEVLRQERNIMAEKLDVFLGTNRSPPRNDNGWTRLLGTIRGPSQGPVEQKSPCRRQRAHEDGTPGIASRSGNYSDIHRINQRSLSADGGRSLRNFPAATRCCHTTDGALQAGGPTVPRPWR
uniref:Uncharacterized protein n=1 Tax=Trypanosoma congolense (strain IL3000) TaxID=1068625 RepID=G0UY38_TRYCI|nr:conserved hypothetical protein [Trypanosoma congolense IL3000]